MTFDANYEKATVRKHLRPEDENLRAKMGNYNFVGKTNESA